MDDGGHSKAMTSQFASSLEVGWSEPLQSPSHQLPVAREYGHSPISAKGIYYLQPTGSLQLAAPRSPQHLGNNLVTDAGVRRWSVEDLIRLTGVDTGGDARLSVLYLAEDLRQIPGGVVIAPFHCESDTADPKLGGWEGYYSQSPGAKRAKGFQGLRLSTKLVFTLFELREF
jgi:hypothetical protein